MELRLLTLTIGPRLLEAVAHHPAGPVRVAWPRSEDHARDCAGLFQALGLGLGHTLGQGVDGRPGAEEKR
jgi:hypothetical protein